MREITFRHGDHVLAGSLHPGAGPVVVLVHGSGPADRTGSTQEWVAGLVGEGLTVFVYDKPGCGQSSGDWRRQTMADRADEALAAVRSVRGEAEVVGHGVALLGGSQGGWVCLVAAAAASELDAIVTVSGPGVGVAEQELFRITHQLPELGFGADEVEAASALLQRRYAALATGDTPASIHGREQVVHGARWLEVVGDTTVDELEFLAGIHEFDPGPALRRLRLPVLGIWGGRDVIVPVRESLDRYLDAVEPHPLTQLIVVPGADHAMRVAGIPGRAPGLWPTIATWLRRAVPTRDQQQG